MIKIKHIAMMVVLVSAMLTGCASSNAMPYGQYHALKHMCNQQGMKPQPTLAYKNGRMYTKTVVCYDEYGAAFDFTQEQ